MNQRVLKWWVMVLSVGLLVACYQIYALKTTPNYANNSAVVASAGGVQKNKPNAVQNNNPADYAQGMQSITYQALPTEAQEVIKMIQARSSFPYRQDGQTFSNREGILPAQSRGYYQEYTVPTPGASNRGARRIVSGQGKTGDNATSGEYFYTADHYRSFARVRME